MSDFLQWHHETLTARTVEALKKHEFDAVYFPRREQAVEHILSFIQPGHKVGFGGSMTVQALGIADRAKDKGAFILNHNAPGINTNNPRTVSGTCSECTSKTRICRVYSILRRKPSLSDTTVVIIGEVLGF